MMAGLRQTVGLAIFGLLLFLSGASSALGELEPTAINVKIPSDPLPLKLCAHRACGGSSGRACELPPGEASINKRHALSKRDAPERIIKPQPGQWAEINMYGENTQAAFIRGEVGRCAKAPRNDPTCIHLFPKSVTMDDKDQMSSVTVTWGSDTHVISGADFRGCVSVLVISSLGAWASHIYEAPTMYPIEEIGTWNGKPEPPTDEEQAQYFRLGALVPLAVDGEKTGRPDENWHTKGLNSLSEDGNIFGPTAEPRIFLFTPYKRNPENPGTPPADGALSHDEPTGTYKNGSSYLTQIKGVLKEVFPDAPLTPVYYAPLMGPDADDDEFDKPQGKFLIQYRPSLRGCPGSKAHARVWFEDQPLNETVNHISWDPLPFQIYPTLSRSSAELKRHVCPFDPPGGDIIPSPEYPDPAKIPGGIPNTTHTQTGSASVVTVVVTQTEVQTTETTTPPAPTKTAECEKYDSLVAWRFGIYKIRGWAEMDFGNGLHDNLNGCGLVTNWNFRYSDAIGGEADFDLPFLIAAGCVERAIISAGGPSLQCKGKGIGRYAEGNDTIDGRNMTVDEYYSSNTPPKLIENHPNYHAPANLSDVASTTGIAGN